MSFSRAKITRFNEHEPSDQRQRASSMISKPLHKPQKNERTTSLNARTISKFPAKPRSLSQPPSNTNVKQSQRPLSVGDEKVKSTNKAKSFKTEYSENFGENKESAIANEEPVCGEQMYKIDESTDDEKQSEKDLAFDPKINSSIKCSSSGIPLRVRQQQHSPRQTEPFVLKKTSPRISSTPTQLSPLRSNETSPTKSSQGKSPPKAVPFTVRNLEIQFNLKKKKAEQLKSEVSNKQKLLTDSVKTMVQLSKKLEQFGKNYSVDELKQYMEFATSESSKILLSSSPGLAGAGEDVQKTHIDADTLQKMQDTLNGIPKKLSEICNDLMSKRLEAIVTLEDITTGTVSQNDLEQTINGMKEENDSIQVNIAQILDEQQKKILELKNKWEVLLANSSEVAAKRIEDLIENVEEKNQQILEHDSVIEEIHNEHEDAIQKSNKVICDLKEKIKSLEHDLNHEKRSGQEIKDKSSLYDQRMKLLKLHVKELEVKHKESESKYIELQKQHRQAQDQLRANEHRWSKEKDDLIAKHKHDKQMLDKLTKDRPYFETRMKALEEMVEEKDKKLSAIQEGKANEIEELRKKAFEEQTQRESLQEKYDSIKDQLVELEIRNKQALGLIQCKSDTNPENTANEKLITSQKEVELYTELLATKVALKAAEDQIQNYNREKLRFIDGIQSLQGEANQGEDFVANAMIKNVEKISELEIQLGESEEIICNQKIEIANLQADLENLRQCSVIDTKETAEPAEDSDLKVMLHEGRVKLEQSLKKSVEYERKIIRYEHDLNKKNKQVCELENLMKLRDGLISVMKAKKDDLQMENDSLNKYANEIRDLLLQAKEQVRNRTEMAQGLSTELDCRSRKCQQLEKKVKELEGSLSATNEKRFRLQESIGKINKELQASKLQRPDAEIQPRYDSFLKLSQTIHKSAKVKQLNKEKLESLINTYQTSKDSKEITKEDCNISEEIEVWLEHYHRKLKHLKQTFRNVSNSIFINDINLHTTPLKYKSGREQFEKNSSWPFTLPASFRYYKPHIKVRPEILTKENRMQELYLVDNKKRNNQELSTKANNHTAGGAVTLTETYRNPKIATRKSSEEITKRKNKIHKNLIEKYQTGKVNILEVQDIADTLEVQSSALYENKSLCAPQQLNSPLPLTPSLRKQLTEEKQSLNELLHRCRYHSTRRLPKRFVRPGSSSIRRKTRTGSDSSFLISKHKLRNIMKSNVHFPSDSVSRMLKTEQARLINHSDIINHHLNKTPSKSVNVNPHYVPKLLAGIRKYKVMHSGASLVWCKPSMEMEMNSILIRQDLLAHSLNKIKPDVNNSINLLTKPQKPKTENLPNKI